MKGAFLGVATSMVVLSGVAVANDNYRYECRHDSDLRTIEVVYLQRESAVPCEVRYLKKNSEETLWNANYEIGYCEKQAEEFVKKQEQWGWSCKKVENEELGQG